MPRSYGSAPPPTGHVEARRQSDDRRRSARHDLAAVLVALGAVAGTVVGSVGTGSGAGVVATVVAVVAAVIAVVIVVVAAVVSIGSVAVAGRTSAVRRARAAVGALVVVVAVLGAVRAAAEWERADPRRVGHFHGWAQVVGDPVPRGAAVRVTLEIEGERFDAVLGGSDARRAARLSAGSVVLVRGDRRAGGPTAAATRRQQVRHVVGRFVLETMADVRPGSRLATSVDRVRRLLRSAADATMPPERASLFTGLVVGDDARQPVSMVERFRAAGLSHLCAVSGQNVAYFLAALAPLLRRLRPTPRAVLATAAVAWFCVLTRMEASVLRAGAMSVVGLWAAWRGRTTTPLRTVSGVTVVLLLVDPMLSWSVGFWLSVGATVGVSTLAPALTAVVTGRRRAPGAVAVVLGAQVGVALPSLLVFGRLPVVAVPANLLAVPVAGLVMLWGFPAAVVHHLLPTWFGPVVMAPCSLGTRWVSTVADTAAALGPGPVGDTVGWLIIAATVVALRWRMRRAHTRVPS